MKYDDLLQTLGEFGKYQKIQYFLVCLISITSSWHAMNMVFVGPTPDHYCYIDDPPEQWENLSQSQTIDMSIPRQTNDEPERCVMYNKSDIDWERGNYTVWVDIERREPYPKCSEGWVYSDKHYKTTIVSEWDLVCDKSSQRGLASTIFFAGRLVGAFISGQLSDRFGRRMVFFVSLGAQVLMGVLCASSVNLYMFYVFYFLQGVFQVAVYLSTYVLGTEVVGPSYRKLVGMAVNFFYAIGQMILVGIAFGIRDWRWIEVAISLPSLIFFVYYWILPESVRWLLANGKREEAHRILKKTATVNQVVLPPDIMDKLEIEDKSEHSSFSVIDLFKNRTYALISLNIWFSWMINALVYYGLNLNTENLHGDPYMNFFIAACVEIPGLIVAYVLLDIVGRRYLMLVFMLIGGAGCIGSAFVPEGQGLEWLIVTLSMLGKLAITASYAIIYLMAAEVFPTVCRNVGMGVASVCARIGGMVAPQFLILRDVYEPLPLLLFGILSVVGGVLCLLLPETKGMNLPQNFEEAVQEFQRGTSSANEDKENKDNTWCQPNQDSILTTDIIKETTQNNCDISNGLQKTGTDNKGFVPESKPGEGKNERNITVMPTCDKSANINTPQMSHL